MLRKELFRKYCSVLIIIETCVFLIIIFNVILLLDKEKFNGEGVHLRRLPKFWTNTGFSPLGDISKYLLNNDTRIHLNLVGSLPNNGLNNIRIHWLLDLIDIEFEDGNHDSPVYNFEKLDTFIGWVDEAGLSLGFEFMGNLSKLFDNRNDTMKYLLWEELTIKIARRYMMLYGIDKLLQWKFESWNEPDLKNYNLLNFTNTSYLQYTIALKKGLKNVDNRLNLRGPAGLFKDKSKHPLCWYLLEFCNEYLGQCPFEILTFHRKGNGDPSQVAAGGQNLLAQIFSEYPKLYSHPVSNDEADPIAGWSTPRQFQSDITYAVDLVKIVLEHYAMKLNSYEFYNLDSISHDNAFMSYHPYEFNQRTLFARFQMNNSAIPYSQFIAKPVYVALGMLAHLGEYAEEPVLQNELSYITTTSTADNFYLAILAASSVSTYSSVSELYFNIHLPHIKENEQMILCVEALETNETNPIELWNSYGNPSYPSAYEREWMRRIQGPKVLESRIITSKEKLLEIKYNLKTPWVGLIRICDLESITLPVPKHIRILRVTQGEILIFWKYERKYSSCIKTFEIKFKSVESESESEINTNIKKDKSWKEISRGWRIPFHYFQFKEDNDTKLSGYYKVRAVDLSGRRTQFSEKIYYDVNGNL